ncbi:MULTISPECIES: histidine kinase [Cupriavidus]|uniref:sensor histidine kinase n=1 Tax=Cupriavidus TaxID=106589 RepID=UPI001D132185|nr:MULTISPECIES: histidine kinase [Cupriavidus]
MLARRSREHRPAWSGPPWRALHRNVGIARICIGGPMEDKPSHGAEPLKLRDVTDAMRRMSAAIETGHRCFRAITDGRGTALAVLAPDGHFVSVNHGAARLLGYTGAELIGRSLADMADDGDRAWIVDCLAASISCTLRSFNVVLHGRDNREASVLLHFQPVMDGRGNCSAVLVIFEEPVVLQQGLVDALMRSEADFRRLYTHLLTGQEHERKRLSSELHDGLGQALTLVKLMVEDALGRMRHGSAEQAESLLETTLLRIRETIGEVRHICNDLRPRLLDDLGLVPALEALCKQTQQCTGNLLVVFDCRIVENEVPDNLKADIFRIAQEAINNIIKHALATEINIVLRRAAKDILLTIQDNGIGFDDLSGSPDGPTFSGLGLLGMRERVESNGGSFALTSGEGSGTLVSAAWRV